MRLFNLLDNNEIIINKKNIEINEFVYDSRNAKSNTMFFALKGMTSDGHSYVNNAYDKGVRAFVIEDEVDYKDDACYIIVKDTRKALSKMSNIFFSNLSNSLKVIGITGTKGKTTTANYIYEMLNNLSIPTGIIGTNGAFYGDISEEIVNTTPESYEIHRIFYKMKKAGMQYVVMEVSSQALMLNRVNDVKFDLAIFTNIHRDHIGPKEHKDFDDYINNKKKLFNMSPVAIINEDDEIIAKISKEVKSKIIGVSTKHRTNYFADNIEFSEDLIKPFTKFQMNGLNYELPVVGIFNVYNAIQMIAALEFFNFNNEIIRDNLHNLKVKGRMEIIKVNGRVFVLDYAHNRISLESTLQTLNKYKTGKIITVVGSVGGRSEERRRELAEVSSLYSDFSIFTSDNPDFEDPLKICLEMKSFYTGKYEAITEPDREKAIFKAYEISNKNDIILVAGKGHEEYQIIKGKHIHYSDRESINKILNKI